MNILSFGASSSKNSINKVLATYAASLVPDATVEVIDLNDFELPLFSVDLEKELGSPIAAQALFNKIGQTDALVIAFAEHNGSYTAAYKNMFDWLSRIHPKVFQNKPMVLLATSPGAGGAANVLKSAVTSAPHFAGVVKGSLSIKSFYDNFDLEKNELKNAEIKQVLTEMMSVVFRQ